jgi:hypothetical protein
LEDFFPLNIQTMILSNPIFCMGEKSVLENFLKNLQLKKAQGGKCSNLSGLLYLDRGALQKIKQLLSLNVNSRTPPQVSRTAYLKPIANAFFFGQISITTNSPGQYRLSKDTCIVFDVFSSLKTDQARIDQDEHRILQMIYHCRRGKRLDEVSMLTLFIPFLPPFLHCCTRIRCRAVGWEQKQC